MRRTTPLLLLAALLMRPPTAGAQIGAVQNLAPGIYFHEGDPRFGTCNNGWIVMAGGVVVVDANFPMGARTVIPKIRALTGEPIQFVIDTHFHPDHCFGNEVWTREGAAVVAQAETLSELRRSGGAAWLELAKTRHDLTGTHLEVPTVTYTDSMAFDDGAHRVELRFFGPAHTHGDTLVWLPRGRILFTGDACVNGAYNYIHDCDLSGWIGVLGEASALGAERVCPGHGPIGGPEVIRDQKAYLAGLRQAVAGMVASGKTLAQARQAAPAVAADLRQDPHIARFVPTDRYFADHVEVAYGQLAGPTSRR